MKFLVFWLLTVHLVAAVSGLSPKIRWYPNEELPIPRPVSENHLHRRNVPVTKDSSKTNGENASNLVWILELDKSHTPADFHRQAESLGIPYKKRFDFQGTLIHGVSIELIPDDRDTLEKILLRLSKLVDAKSVTTAWPSVRMKIL